MEYEIDLEIFQGPLALLYNLIKRKKIKITRVSLAEITEQYLSYLGKLKEFDLDIASEFMVIASELLELKTQQLLPENQSEEKKESKSNLVHRLKIYRKYKNAAQKLTGKEKEAKKLFARRLDVTEKYTQNYRLVIEEDINKLAEIYQKALTSFSTEKDEEKATGNIDLNFIKEESINVKEKIEEISKIVEYNPDGVEFRELITDRDSCLEVIVTLLGVLELIQKNKLKVKQDRLFSEIVLYKVKEKVLT